MNTIELKKKFLDFFSKKEHKIIHFSPLIPENDPTVLFTTAGMHPLVPFLMGQQHPLGKRLANVQICIRTTDIDEVGDTSHFTFFEMLGNWSLGDYFKEDAIKFAYEFLTSSNYLNLDYNRLAITCFKGNKEKNIPKDEVSSNFWKELGINKERIVYLNEKGNWWGPAGTTGPCGPDTEIHYWFPNNEPAPVLFDPNDERWVEIWNLVFIEYNKEKDGTFTKLKQKNVDTGLGVERVCAILNGVNDVFFTGKIYEVLKFVEELMPEKINYNNSNNNSNNSNNSNNNNYNNNLKSFKIIVDHLRASVFILADNRCVGTSNVDQGYILRRFIRRAIRHANVLGLKHKFITKIANKIIDLYNKEYPHILKRKDFIISELDKEENKFIITIENGLKEFNKIIINSKTISSKDAFLLYQSYGFPIEVTCELASEKNIEVDINGFFKEYKKHQELSRVGAEKKFKGGLSEDNKNTRKLHTATHILNEVLRRFIDKDIKQKGSNINSERLRFDFNFSRKLTVDELQLIEDKVNEIILKSLKVHKTKMKLEDALNSGAQAEFGTKYPEEVWVYSIGDFSKEICMGPHVDNTNELGSFKIKKEQSIASGVRRIKAVLE
jgi:alanyl-tRNA synthetase